LQSFKLAALQTFKTKIFFWASFTHLLKFRYLCWTNLNPSIRFPYCASLSTSLDSAAAVNQQSSSILSADNLVKHLFGVRCETLSEGVDTSISGFEYINIFRQWVA
jgi:hypothetical protein